MSYTEIVLPVMKKLVRRIFSLWHAQKCSAKYSSFESAERGLSGFKYEDEKLLNMVYKKTERFRHLLKNKAPFIVDESNIQTITGLASFISKDNLSVIDFGGACGTHYYISKAFFGERVKMKWYVIETKGMVRKAKPLENNELRFFEDLSIALTEIGKVDLVFSSSTLQYLPDPYETLDRLTNCGGNYLYLTRLPLTTKSYELISIQKSRLSANGPGEIPKGMKDGITKHPITFLRKDKVEEILNKKYDILAQINENKGVLWLGGYSFDNYGYLCRLR